MKDKIGTVRTALTLAGGTLGAGFLSGQELWQYFGVHGIRGLAGMAAAIAALSFFSFALISFCMRSGISEMDRAVMPGDSPVLRGLFGLLSALLHFSIITIMSAGIGALAAQLLSLPAWAASLPAAALGAWIACRGIRGVVKVFSADVPVLIFCSVCICAVCTAKNGLHSENFFAGGTNPLLGGWAGSALNYAALCFFGLIALLVPLSGHIRSRRDAALGSALGGLILFLVGTGILLSVFSARESADYPLPMLHLASGLGKLPGAVYGMLLFLGMFGNLAASSVSLLVYASQKSAAVRAHRNACACLLGAAAFLSSLAGFTGLISVVWPVFGYVGMASLLLFLVRVLRFSGKLP